MGMMTTITILNDGWEEIKKNPEQFMKNIELGMNGKESYSGGEYYSNKFVNNYGIGNYANPMWVTQSTHANLSVLMLSYGNMLVPFGQRNIIKSLDVRKEMLEKAKAIIKEEEEIIKKIESKK